MPKLNGLSTKQRLFCEFYVAHGLGDSKFNATKAAVEAGYSEKSARVIAAENLSKPAIQQEIQRLIKEIEEKSQITPELVIQKIKEGLEANRVISAVKGNKADGQTTDFIEVPDYSTRQKYVNNALEVLGMKAPKAIEFKGEMTTEDKTKQDFMDFLLASGVYEGVTKN